MSVKKSDLLPRLITAVVGVPVLLAIIFFTPAWAFFLLIAGAAGVSMWEYCTITYGNEHPPAKWLTVALGILVCATMYFAPALLLEAIGVATLSLLLFFLFFYRDQTRVTHQLGSSLTAILYGGILLTTLALLARDSGANAPYWIVMVLAVVWLSDTGAYFAGVTFGKRKLYPSVSPNKSVEGAMGGMAASIAAGFICNGLYVSFVDHWQGLSVGTILLLTIPANFLGQTGDLVESLVKRCHDVKDSGTIIYGHGGILDRIDALIFASPWFYYFFSNIL